MPTKTVVENYKLYVGHPGLSPGQSHIEILYYPNSHAYKESGEVLIGVSGVIDHMEKEGLRNYYVSEALAHLTRELIPQNDGVFQLPTEESWKEACKKARVAHKIKSDRGKDNGTYTHSWLEEFLIAKRDGTEAPLLPKQYDIPSANGLTKYEDLLDIEVKKEFNNLVEALSQFIHWFDQHEVEVVELERLVFSKTHRYAGRFDAILRIDGKLVLVDFKTNNPSQYYPDGIYPTMFCQLGGYDFAYTEEMGDPKKSMFDKHAIFNFNKKTGKFNKRFVEGDDLGINRNWFIHELASKRADQYHTRRMSMQYKENRK